MVGREGDRVCAGRWRATGRRWLSQVLKRWRACAQRARADTAARGEL